MAPFEGEVARLGLNGFVSSYPFGPAGIGIADFVARDVLHETGNLAGPPFVHPLKKGHDVVKRGQESFVLQAPQLVCRVFARGAVLREQFPDQLVGRCASRLRTARGGECQHGDGNDGILL